MMNTEQLKTVKVCQQLVGRARLSVASSGKASQKQGRETGLIQTHCFLGQIQHGAEILSSETKAQAQLCGLGQYSWGRKKAVAL